MTYALLLPFDTDDPRFVRGFEIGRLWAQTEDVCEHEAMIHVENAEMVLRIAEARGLEVRSEELDERWILVTFTTPVNSSPSGGPAP